jgi:hypothetical protein
MYPSAFLILFSLTDYVQAEASYQWEADLAGYPADSCLLEFPRQHDTEFQVELYCRVLPWLRNYAAVHRSYTPYIERLEEQEVAWRALLWAQQNKNALDRRWQLSQLRDEILGEAAFLEGRMPYIPAELFEEIP